MNSLLRSTAGVGRIWPKKKIRSYQLRCSCDDDDDSLFAVYVMMLSVAQDI
jgi:hypothetical protein